ncbi:hypothetical protein A0H76_578 [Hepatospora eriocheir]|uniref:Uncharacterized protein n=1 Tax=Hepatospora eriocheir TaxID=1081669 RepID=A0A1X0Q816_9MICR|nr:hypothetical protein A0H76_578 [Hepatospora eriocheir]
MDMISNVDFETIPYILSYTEFEYSTVRYTKIELSKVVKSMNEKEFYYEINGIVYFGDSKFTVTLKN